MPTIFISYASVDVAAAELLEFWLESAGYKTWRDRSKLLAGARWRLEIKQAIEHSDAVIALLSDKFVESEPCENESDYARACNKLVVPVRLKSNIRPFGFLSRNMIDFREQDILAALGAFHLLKAAGSSGDRRQTGTTAETLPERIFGEDLGSLLDAYKETERNLSEQLITTFHRYLESLGALPRGNAFVFEGRSYELTIGQGTFGRALEFELLPVGGPAARQTYSAPVAMIGRILSITIEWALPRPATEILQILQEKARRAYVALQRSFESHYSKMRSSLFDGLDDILRNGHAECDSAQYQARLAFTVTTTDKSLFVFYFSPAQMHCVLEHLQQDQQPRKSPFEYLYCLITEEPTDSFWNWGLFRAEEFAVLPFESLEAAATHVDNWRAQTIFFRSEQLAVREVCRTEEFSLQINAPPELREVVNPGLDAASFALKHQFRKNAYVFLEHNNSVRATATSAQDPNARGHGGGGLWEKVAAWLAGEHA